MRKLDESVNLQMFLQLFFNALNIMKNTNKILTVTLDKSMIFQNALPHLQEMTNQCWLKIYIVQALVLISHKHSPLKHKMRLQILHHQS